MYHPTIEEVKNLAREGDLIPIWKEVPADLETPTSAFLKISKSQYCFLLESIEGGERLARYSFIGSGPYKVVTFNKDDAGDPLEAIARELKRYRPVNIPGLPRFSGGAVGYLSYEVARRFENIPAPEEDPLGLPEAVFLFTDTLLIFDHASQKIIVLSHAHLDGNIEAAYREATERIERLVEKLSQPLYKESRPLQPKFSTPASNFSRQEFEAGVISARELIASGEAIQVVISQRLSQPTVARPFDIYRALRRINPSPYMFYLKLKDFYLIGASPEVLVRVEGETVMTRPLAGTRPRGKTPEEDKKLEEDLLGNEKERAEHIMLVDLGRNDIGRVSRPGTVQVSELMNVERYSHVMHMVTHIQGKLRPDLDCFAALRACFPAGTVSGAPKIRAMQLIAEIEKERRGPYAGAVGYFSFSGNMDMAIAIRTIVMNQGIAHAQAGCGVVYDSQPGSEYQETLNKAKALLEAIKQAEESYAPTC